MRFALARRCRWRPVRARAHGRGAERRSAGRAHQQGRLWPARRRCRRCSRTTTSSRTGRRWRRSASSGWAGRLTDLCWPARPHRAWRASPPAATVLLAGRHSSGYRVGPQGSTAIDLLRHGLYGSEACTALLRDLIAAPRPHLMESELAAIALRSIATDARLRDALATVPPPPSFAGVDTPLAGQLRIVAASSPRASRWRAPPSSSCPRTAMTTTPACATTIPPCCANWARRWRPSRRNWTGWGWPIR